LTPSQRFERTARIVFVETRREIDDWDKAASINGNARACRSTSSLDGFSDTPAVSKVQLRSGDFCFVPRTDGRVALFVAVPLVSKASTYQSVRAIAGRVFDAPRRESMIEINELRFSAAHPLVAQLHHRRIEVHLPWRRSQRPDPKYCFCRLAAALARPQVAQPHH
jgi:hypothetical protein